MLNLNYTYDSSNNTIILYKNIQACLFYARYRNKIWLALSNFNTGLITYKRSNIEEIENFILFYKLRFNF